MLTEVESFWDAQNFAVITDKTKPAIKWTINELTKLGKNVYTVDLSNKPDDGTLHNISELPDGIECAVIGVTRTQPADVMHALEKKGINKMWIHWRTDTPEVKKRCEAAQMQCITGRCPMMYLGGSTSIHGVHRSIAKLLGKY